ncbi:GIN domain-containing protein [Sphingomonas hankookensis]
MKPFLTLALLASAVPTPALAQEARSFVAAGFDRIAARGCDNIVVTPGTGFAVQARGSAGSLAAIEVAVRGQVLTITRAPGSCDSRARKPAATIAITLPALRGLEAAGTGSVRIGTIEGPVFEAQLRGTGNLTIAGLRVPRVTIDRSGTGTATLDGVQAGRLSLTLSGTGRIVAGGRVDALAITASGTGHVDTSTLTTNGLSIRASGTGSVRAQASGPAAVDASGIARVTVTGRAQCSVNQSGLARVTCG